MSERRRKTPTLWFKIGIAIIIIGFIGGIILGAIDKATISEWNSITEEYDYKEIFNIAVMIYIWIGCLISSSFFLAVGSILYRLNLIIDGKEYETKLEKTNVYKKKATNNEVPSVFKF